MRRPPTPKAYSFELRRCNNPKCGPHIIAFNEINEEICDVAIPLDGALSFIEALQAIMYEVAVESDYDR